MSYRPASSWKAFSRSLSSLFALFPCIAKLTSVLKDVGANGWRSTWGTRVNLRVESVRSPTLAGSYPRPLCSPLLCPMSAVSHSCSSHLFSSGLCRPTYHMTSRHRSVARSYGYLRNSPRTHAGGTCVLLYVLYVDSGLWVKYYALNYRNTTWSG